MSDDFLFEPPASEPEAEAKATPAKKKSRKPKAKKQELSFEEALAQLEQIVEEMEAGDLSLDQSLKHFEKGMTLAQTCSISLNTIEKKVEVLLKQAADGESAEWQAFSDPNQD